MTKIDTLNKEWRQVTQVQAIKALPKSWGGLWSYFLYVVGINKVAVLVEKDVTMSMWVKDGDKKNDVKLEINPKNNG